ncbi:MAG: hypothetical protein M1836_002251, partial [Candelina mexicana]
SILPHAANISFHHLQTFPNRNYGYIELPTMDADKVKKKLNGSILKGSKIRVDEARPKKRRTPNVEMAAYEPDKPQKRKKSKTETDVLTGVELTDRKVQRGWTKPPGHTKAAKGKKAKAETSAHSTKSECLFRTTLPANVAVSDQPSTSTKSKSKARREAVVHEFSNNSKHATFMRGKQAEDGGQVVSQYVDRKGWIDDQGTLVEPAVASTDDLPRSSAKPQTAKERKRDSPSSQSAVPVNRPDERQADSKARTAEDNDETSSSGTSSDDLSSHSGRGSDEERDGIHSTAEPPISTSKTFNPEAIPPRPSKLTTNGHHTSNTDTTSPIKVAAPSPKASLQPKEIHPLETIFKQPNSKSLAPNSKPNLQVQTSFSFFDPDADEQPPAMGKIPRTPFTQRDFQERGLRSAAPTPDTAAPGRNFLSGWARAEKEEEEEEEKNEKAEASPSPKNAVAKNSVENEECGTEESSFKDWFWKHRGEANRAWKKRRRETAKKKRKLENQRHSDQIS